MKITQKLLSLLLVAIMVAGMIATVATANTFPNLGKNDSIVGMPYNAENVQYLSDLCNTNVVDQVNNKVVLDKNYHDYLYAFSDGARRVIKKGSSGTDANGNRTLENGITYNATDIALGYRGVKFSKGLGVHPSAPGSADRYLVYDVSKLNADHFYAVVGGTGEKITDPNSKDYYLEFELLGSKASTYDANSFESLGKAENIRSYLVAEFDVDITGYNYLKLVVRATGTSNTSCGGAWADACVYTAGTASAPNTPSGNPSQPDAFIPSADGIYEGIPSEYMNSISYLSDGNFAESSNNNGNPSTLNAPYGEPNKNFTIGNLDTTFWSGIGMHPKKPGEGESWTIYDVSAMNGDRFYAVVGITNANGKNGAGSGVIFGVYGDYGDGNYVLLAQSTLITKRDSGEFNVDITGVKNLKLTVISGGNTNASSGSAWADASVYSTTATSQPTEPSVKPTEKPTTKPTEAVTEPSAETPAEFPWGIAIGIAAAVVVAIAVVVIIIVLKKKKAN